MRGQLVYLLLLALKGLSRLIFRYDVGWVGEVPEDRWGRIRILAILNHTSLFEPILAGVAPNHLLREVARHGVAPVAHKTATRPIVGRFFRFVAGDVVPITRERDHTWEEVLTRVDDPRTMAIILPEGRMKRRTGLDAHGRPMTVRGGIADILRTVPRGRMLLVYSGGLHHVHAPGDRLPRIFRCVRLRLEAVEIGEYRRRRLKEGGEAGFKAAVVADLTGRRDRHCPTEERADAEVCAS